MNPPLILAIDPGSKMGWAAGQAGGHPTSASERVPLEGLLEWLQQFFTDKKPDMVVVEAMLPLRAYARLKTAEHSVYLAARQHGVIQALTGLWKIPYHEPDVLAVRQHFTGARSHGGRKEGKRAVIGRCHQLRYLPRDCVDNDRADALATWDFACATLARKPPKELVMFAAA